MARKAGPQEIGRRDSELNQDESQPKKVADPNAPKMEGDDQIKDGAYTGVRLHGGDASVECDMCGEMGDKCECEVDADFDD